jgi:hypothetical protein
VEEELTRYGRFFLECASEPYVWNRCEASLVAVSGKRTRLFSVPDCMKSGGPGITVPGGALHTPAVARDGTEFHVFDIAAARGGNAAPGQESWGVVVTKDAAWAGKIMGEDDSCCVRFETARVIEGPPPRLVVTQEPTTTRQPRVLVRRTRVSTRGAHGAHA